MNLTSLSIFIIWMKIVICSGKPFLLTWQAFGGIIWLNYTTCTMDSVKKIKLQKVKPQIKRIKTIYYGYNCRASNIHAYGGRTHIYK